MHQRHRNLCPSCNIDVSAPQESLSFLEYLIMYQRHRIFCSSLNIYVSAQENIRGQRGTLPVYAL